ncbi:MAG: hypothetical protein ACOCVZ_00695 [Gemmatimonadota bacterium]
MGRLDPLIPRRLPYRERPKAPHFPAPRSELMTKGDSTPDPTPPGHDPLPVRRLSTEELEAVIRRAVELQTAAGGSEEGVAESEVVRIGQELGLEEAHVRRAITDIRGRPPREGGLLARVMGPGRVRAARTIRRPAAQLGALLEDYLVEFELMHPHRRFPDRTRYVRDESFAAGVSRFTRSFGTREPRLDLKQLDVGVSRVDEDTAFVELSIDLSGERTGYAAGGAALGTATSVPTVLFPLVTGAPDALVLAAIPIFGGWMAGMRAGYRYSARQVQEKLESFLDRVEHGDLKISADRDGTWADALKRLKRPF